MSPYHLQPNTFQLVLMSDMDKKKTYALYLYESVGWDRTVHRRPSTIGYYETRWRRTRWKQLWMSNTMTAFRIANIVGNTGGHVAWLEFQNKLIV